MKSTILEDIDFIIREGQTVHLSKEDCLEIIALLAKDKLLWWEVSIEGESIEVKARECMNHHHFDEIIARSLNDVERVTYSRHLILCDNCNNRYQQYLIDRGLK